MNIPEIGLGTWNLTGDKCTQVVRMALELGYCHIDTAFAYENHKAIAKAIKEVRPDQLFITSKISLGQATKTYTQSNIDHTNIEKSVSKACDLALQELGIERLDLMLIHWPIRSTPMEEVLAALDKQVEKGKLRYVGVSNYTAHHLQDAYDQGLKVAFNQVEFHPYLYQKDLLEFARANGTELIAFRPLGKGNLLNQESLFAEIGELHGKSPAQVILRWLLQKGIPTVPKASTEAHLKENIDIFDFSLSEDDERRIDGLNKNFRFCDSDWGEFDY
ncbi:MAG: Glyoxal reductase [Chlamydiae bacterium]|nr:Glyoxal reductase [Chlamydiota bacterium]